MISDSETYVDANDKRQPAVKWLLEVIADPPAAAAEKVVRIHSLEVLDTLGLLRRKNYRFSVDEFRDRMQEFDKQAKAAHDASPAERTQFQKKILELDNRLRMYSVLLRAFEQPRLRRDHISQDLLEAMQEQQQMFTRFKVPLAIPPASGTGDWEPYAMAWTKAFAQANVLNQEPNKVAVDFSEIVSSYAKGDAAAFNKAVAGYEKSLAHQRPEGINIGKVDFEAFFNHARLFFWASWMYFVAFVLAGLAWLGWQRPLNRAAFALIAFTFLLHSFALVSRIYISGRPPVTNLYSAAIFVGWAAVLLGMLLEGVYRLGIGNIVAATAGFATLLIADRLAADGGDTFIVLQAVLDTQFWLATHVTCITLGYATTFVAGLLGIIYILGGVLTPSLTKEKGAELARMTYGVVLLLDLLQLRGHGARRPVGRRLVGTLLGLGSKGKRRPDHRALERACAARPLGRHGEGARPGRIDGAGQRRSGLVGLRRESTFGRPALLRIHRGNRAGAIAVFGIAIGNCGPGHAAAALVAQLGGRGGVRCASRCR